MEDDPGHAATPLECDISGERGDEAVGDSGRLVEEAACQASSDPQETPAGTDTETKVAWKEMSTQLSRAAESANLGSVKHLEALKQKTEENHAAAIVQIKAVTAVWRSMIDEKEAELYQSLEETKNNKLKALTERETWFYQFINRTKELESESSPEQQLLEEGATILSSLTSSPSPHHSHITAHPGLGFCANINDSILQALSLGMWVSGEDVREGEKISVSAVGGLQPNGTFWVRRVTSDPWRQEYALQHISNSLFEVPQSSQPLEEVSLGQLCVGQFSQDGRWYRAVVTTLPRPGVAKYFFLDHGGNEEAPVSTLYPLPDHFRAFPFQMIHVCLTSDPSVNFNTREMRWKFTDFTHKKQLAAEILRQSEVDEAGPVYLIRLTDHTQEEPFDVGQILITAAKMKESTSKFKSRDVRFKEQREAAVGVPVTTNSSQQQQQLNEDKQTIEPLLDSSPSSSSSDQAAVTLTAVGGREVEEEEGEGGGGGERDGEPNGLPHNQEINSEDQTLPTPPSSNIDPLLPHPSHPSPPPPPSHSPLLNDEADSGPDSIPQQHQIQSGPESIPLENASPDSIPQEIPAKIIDSIPPPAADNSNLKPTPLQLGPEVEGVLEKNIGPHGNGDEGDDDDVAENVTERLHSSVKIGARLTVEVVTDLSTNGDFWCQLLLPTDEDRYYDDLQDDLQAELGRGENEAFTPVFYHEGELCTARFSEDDNWYRGRIERVSPGVPHIKFTVRYVDFGNSEERHQHQLKPLGSKFKLLPLRAIRCNMATAEHVTFNKMECEKFFEVTNRDDVAIEVLTVGEDNLQSVIVKLVQLTPDNRDPTDLTQLILSSDKQPPPSRQWSSSNDLISQNIAHVADWASHMEDDIEQEEDSVFLTLPGQESSREATPLVRETTPLAREATPITNSLPHPREPTPTPPPSDTRMRGATPTSSSTIPTENISSVSMTTTTKSKREATPTTLSAPQLITSSSSSSRQTASSSVTTETTNMSHNQREATPTFRPTTSSPVINSRSVTKSGTAQREATPTQQEAAPTQWVPLTSKPSNFLQRVSHGNKEPQRVPGGGVRQARLDVSRAKQSIMSSLAVKPLPRSGRHDDEGSVSRRNRQMTSSGKLYVKYPPDQLSHSNLQDLFSRHGEIITVDPHTTDSSIVYLTMDVKGAEEAVNRLHGHQVSPGYFLIVEKYRNRSPSPPPHAPPTPLSSSIGADLSRVDHMKLFVKNLSGDHSASNLRAVFSRYGRVLKMIPDLKRKHVTYIYMDVEGGTKAINNLHGKAISKNGKPLVVEVSHEPKNR